MTNEPVPAPRPGRPVFTVEELSALAPGLGTIMPEIGLRAGKLYHAAKAGNWPLAEFEAAEVQGLMNRASRTRPNYADDLKSYMDETWKGVRAAVAAKDAAKFLEVFNAAINMANDYHDGAGYGFIVWKVPDASSLDLDVTPKS